jgi:hephaestin
MVPDNIGMWMFHCHVDDHMEAGMMAMYEVTK